VDGTLVDAHSDKQGAAGTYKGGFGFYPLVCYLDRGDGAGEALAGILRPGNAGSNTAQDHVEVVDLALAQLPTSARERPLLVRADTGGATHALTGHLRQRGVRFSISLPADERVRAAVLAVPPGAWQPAIDADGQPRAGAEVAELATLDLAGWPQGTRAICRREDPHPGAQLSFTDADGHRFQVFITDQPDPDAAALELRHRRRARIEDRIRCGKATGLRNLPFDLWRRNEVWLELVLAAQDLLCWARVLLLDGDLKVAEQQQDPALSAAAPGRPHRPPRPPPDRAPATPLALGQRAGRRVRPPARAAAALLILPDLRTQPGRSGTPACRRRPRCPSSHPGGSGTARTRPTQPPSSSEHTRPTRHHPEPTTVIGSQTLHEKPRLTSPLTVRVDLRKCSSAQR
jgi:hypothetical protein